MPQPFRKENENQPFTDVNESSIADSQKLVGVIGEGLLEKQAEDITVLDVHKLTTLTDCFVVCGASTAVQIKAIANSVIEATKEKLNEKPWKEEGRNARRWIVLDYVNVVVHIFRTDLREHYALERIWSDADISKIKDPKG